MHNCYRLGVTIPVLVLVLGGCGSSAPEPLPNQSGSDQNVKESEPRSGNSNGHPSSQRAPSKTPVDTAEIWTRRDLKGRSESVGESHTDISEPDIRWLVHLQGKCTNSGIIDGNLVILGVRSKTEGNHFEARNIADGRLVWSSSAGGGLAQGPNGTIFVAATTSVIALNTASGKEKWRFSRESAGHFLAPPTLDGKQLYVADDCCDPNHPDAVGISNFYCLDKDTGEKLWQVSIPTGVVAPVSFDENFVYVVREYGFSCISKKARSIVWSKKIDTVRAPAVPTGSGVAFPASLGLKCLASKDGSKLWAIDGGPNDYRMKERQGILYTALALHLQNDPHSLNFDSYFAAVRQDNGEIVWKRPFTREVRGGVAIDGARLYLTCWDDNLYCLDAQNGNILWRYQVDFKQWAPIPLLANNTILLCFQDQILCIGQRK